MTDDVEDTLASLEQRLRALQAELDAEEEPEPERRRFEPRRDAQARAFEPRRDAEPPPPAPPPAPARPSLDALDRFGAELRRLVDAWERTAAEVRGDAAEAIVFRGGVALEARGELRQLCGLERALLAIDGVAAVRLRAYAGGAAALEVALEREVALVAELRRSVAFELVQAGAGRLSIALS